ncbi:MAG: hypothetical protein KF773_05125 [Deltaproteobacteria bacterium]|nr:hypothetical protein [Deltaproteobacteria bacterium]MCW5803244.1 hypothetical protein [Deltaproteobacteria bacterium]
MKKLTTTLFLSLALFATACGKGKAGEVIKLKDELCACKDKKCAEEVNKKLDAELEKFKTEPDEETTAKLMGAMIEAGECLAKFEKEGKSEK